MCKHPKQETVESLLFKIRAHIRNDNPDGAIVLIDQKLQELIPLDDDQRDFASNQIESHIAS